MSKNPRDINVPAWKMQFYKLFFLGRETVEKSINTRLFNNDPSKNYPPELEKLFWNTLSEFITEYPSCNLQVILDEQNMILLGEEANNSDFTS